MLIPNKLNSYYFISRGRSKIIGVDNKNKIFLFDKNKKFNDSQTLWNLIKIKRNRYLIQSNYNRKYLEEYKNNLVFGNNEEIYIINNENKIKKNFLFNLIKIFEYDEFGKN